MTVTIIHISHKTIIESLANNNFNSQIISSANSAISTRTPYSATKKRLQSFEYGDNLCHIFFIRQLFLQIFDTSLLNYSK